MHRIQRIARHAGAVGVASVAAAVLAACGGAGTVTVGGGTEPSESTTAETTEPVTTTPPTTQPSTSAAPTTPRPQVQPATEGDLEPAKQTVVDFYTKASVGDFAGACHHMLNTRTKVGLADGDPLHTGCVSSLEKEKDQFAQLQGRVSIDQVSAALQPDGHVDVRINDSDSALTIVKGADGGLYIDVSR